MHETNFSSVNFFKHFSIEGLTESAIRSLAYECGFVKRLGGKIDVLNLFHLICSQSIEYSPSFNDLASGLDSRYQICVSKQAVWKRINDACVLFFQAVLAKLIKVKLEYENTSITKQACTHKRILVQDSTIIKLPTRLYTFFSGVSNAHSSVCNARIQGTYDLLSGCFISFSIDPYSKNDISAAPELEVQKGDLVLRDRGYFTLSEVERHSKVKADCIFRHKIRTIYLDPDSQQPLNLQKRLIIGKKFEMMVCLNNEERTKVRLIALPVSEEVANRRRQKLKREMRGHAPSKELLDQMSWTIFITTIASENTDDHGILNLYRLRWRIESIFKSWKSYMSFSQVHNVSERQLHVLIIARLIMVVLYTQVMYEPLRLMIKNHHDKELSLMKFVNYVMKNFQNTNRILIDLQLGNTERMHYHLNSLARYCTYDKRKRMNFNQMLNCFSLS